MMEPHYDREVITPAPKDSRYLPGGINLKLSQSEVLPGTPGQQVWAWHAALVKISLFGASLFLFILSITLMKYGARGLTSLVSTMLSVNNFADSLGFGWLFAYIIMSGSPVAAAALTFFDAGVIDELATYAMITGSRLGASLIVLIVGFLYVLRGRNRSTSLSMGLLSLTVTATTYLPALLLGTLLLRSGMLNSIQITSGTLLLSIVDLIFNPIALLVTSLLPDWGVFLVGLGTILISFNLFDKCLPQMTIKRSKLGWMSRLVYRPWVMFVLGALVTMVSMSVSLSLSILVPLSARGYVRRENVIPYIMGANITTFIDTLLAAVLLGNPLAFSIVFVGMVSIAVVSILILMSIYHSYHQWMVQFEAWILSTNRRFTFFVILILSIPVILLLI